MGWSPLNGTEPDIHTWTPVLTGTTGLTGNSSSSYIYIGQRTIFVRGSLSTSTTLAWGTQGSWRVTPPIAPKLSTYSPVIGRWYMYAQGNYGSFGPVGPFCIDPNGKFFFMWSSKNAVGFTPIVPSTIMADAGWGLRSNAFIEFYGVYEAAS